MTDTPVPAEAWAVGGILLFESDTPGRPWIGEVLEAPRGAQQRSLRSGKRARVTRSDTVRVRWMMRHQDCEVTGDGGLVEFGRREVFLSTAAQEMPCNQVVGCANVPHVLPGDRPPPKARWWWRYLYDVDRQQIFRPVHANPQPRVGIVRPPPRVSADSDLPTQVPSQHQWVLWEAVLAQIYGIMPTPVPQGSAFDYVMAFWMQQLLADRLQDRRACTEIIRGAWPPLARKSREYARQGQCAFCGRADCVLEWTPPARAPVWADALGYCNDCHTILQRLAVLRARLDADTTPRQRQRFYYHRDEFRDHVKRVFQAWTRVAGIMESF